MVPAFAGMTVFGAQSFTEFLIAKLNTICFKKDTEALRFVGRQWFVLGFWIPAFAGMTRPSRE